MKTETHPEYTETNIKCSCGNVIKTRSTQKDTHVEACSSCHPFFTGKQTFASKAGRVEKFKQKYAKNK